MDDLERMKQLMTIAVMGYRATKEVTDNDSALGTLNHYMLCKIDIKLWAEIHTLSEAYDDSVQNDR